MAHPPRTECSPRPGHRPGPACCHRQPVLARRPPRPRSPPMTSWLPLPVPGRRAPTPARPVPGRVPRAGPETPPPGARTAPQAPPVGRGEQRGEPEFLAASRAAVPHLRPERADRLGHGLEHPVPGQGAQRGPGREPQRPAADGRPRQRRMLSSMSRAPPARIPAVEPGATERAGPSRSDGAGQARAGQHPAAGYLPPGNRFSGPSRTPRAIRCTRSRPASRFTRAYPSRTQNAAPSAAMAAPPSAGYTPAHTTAPITHSRAPMAGSARRHRRWSCAARAAWRYRQAPCGRRGTACWPRPPSASRRS